MNFSADLIDDRIWLGSIAAMHDNEALDMLHITHILSLLETEPKITVNDSRIRKYVCVEDMETTDLLVEFDACYDFIDQALNADANNNVLIHCLAGMSRSATIACMWLMRRHKLPVEVALERLTAARPCVRPNPGFAAQLHLFEKMNHQLDATHTLYREFQLERARASYIDHDTELDGLEQKNLLRQQFRDAFTPPHGHAECTVTATYTCRQCRAVLFTNADLSRHSEGVGLFDWFKKFDDNTKDNSLLESECHKQMFTHYLGWLMNQIDTPSNPHDGPIQCPKCSSTVGTYALNGAKCACGKWVSPAFYFEENKIEKQQVTSIEIETNNQL